MKKRLSEREGGQLLILPPEAEAVSGEDGALSIRTLGSSLHHKGMKSLVRNHSPTLETRVLCPFRHPTSAGDRQPTAAVAGYALCDRMPCAAVFPKTLLRKALIRPSLAAGTQSPCRRLCSVMCILSSKPRIYLSAIR